MALTRSLKQVGFAGTLLATAVIGSLFANPVHPAAHAAQPLGSTEVRLNPSGEPIGVNREAVLALALAGSLAAGVGISTIHRQMHPHWAEENLEPRSRRDRGSVRFDASSHLHSANPRLQQKLVRLLHDDRAAASRLVAQAQIRYPGQSPNWYVEKVIYDLQRDRGRV